MRGGADMEWPLDDKLSPHRVPSLAGLPWRLEDPSNAISTANPNAPVVGVTRPVASARQRRREGKLASRCRAGEAGVEPVSLGIR